MHRFSTFDRSFLYDFIMPTTSNLWRPFLVARSKCASEGRGHPLLPMKVSGSKRAAGPGRDTRAEAGGWRAAGAAPSLCAGHEEPASTPTLPLCQVCHPDIALQPASRKPERYSFGFVLQDADYWLTVVYENRWVWELQSDLWVTRRDATDWFWLRLAWIEFSVGCSTVLLDVG